MKQELSIREINVCASIAKRLAVRDLELELEVGESTIGYIDASIDGVDFPFAHDANWIKEVMDCTMELENEKIIEMANEHDCAWSIVQDGILVYSKACPTDTGTVRTIEDMNKWLATPNECDEEQAEAEEEEEFIALEQVGYLEWLEEQNRVKVANDLFPKAKELLEAHLEVLNVEVASGDHEGYTLVEVIRQRDEVAELLAEAETK